MHIVKYYIEYTVKVTFLSETITTFRCVVYSDAQIVINSTVQPHLPCIYFFFHHVFVLNVFTHRGNPPCALNNF